MELWKNKKTITFANNILKIIDINKIEYEPINIPNIQYISNYQDLLEKFNIDYQSFIQCQNTLNSFYKENDIYDFILRNLLPKCDLCKLNIYIIEKYSIPFICDYCKKKLCQNCAMLYDINFIKCVYCKYTYCNYIGNNSQLNKYCNEKINFCLEYNSNKCDCCLLENDEL